MAKSTKKLKFEEATARLDEIVAAMESGEVGLEESISLYEEAMKLASHCRKTLDSFEARIQKIQVDAGGEPQIEPFDRPKEESEDEGE